MAAKELVQVACYLRPEQHKQLKRLSEQAIVPMQVFLRQAVDDLLVKLGAQDKPTTPEMRPGRVKQ